MHLGALQGFARCSLQCPAFVTAISRHPGWLQGLGFSCSWQTNFPGFRQRFRHPLILHIIPLDSCRMHKPSFERTEALHPLCAHLWAVLQICSRQAYPSWALGSPFERLPRYPTEGFSHPSTQQITLVFAFFAAGSSEFETTGATL